MRKLVLLSALAGAVWWLLGRRSTATAERVGIGYEDGSSLALESGAPGLGRLVEIARGVLRA